MAVLGIEGIVRLRREAPDPIVINASTLRGDINAFVLNTQDYWSGDEVYLYADQGLPLAGQCSLGVAMYQGGYWDVGPNREHIADSTDYFYKQADEADILEIIGTQDGDTLVTQDGNDTLLGVYGERDDFYCDAGTQSGTFFIYRDQLNRLSLYNDYCAAVNGDPNGRIDLAQYNFQSMLMAPAGTEEYNNALTECVAAVGQYRFSDARDEATLKSICDFAPEYASPAAGTTEYDDTNLAPRRWVNGFPWVLLCELQEWSLELDSSAIDTTQVGEKFGESVKSIVTGGGKFDFLVGDAKPSSTDDQPVDPSYLMQLMMMTERGAKAEAEFWMMRTRASTGCSQLARGGLYYKTNLLVTNIAVNVRAADVIVGSASFVTSGEIALKIGGS